LFLVRDHRAPPLRRESRQSCVCGVRHAARTRTMADTAPRTFVITLAVLWVVVGPLALWKVKIVLALVFLGLILAAAMRPGVDRLAQGKGPMPLGGSAHCAPIAAA